MLGIGLFVIALLFISPTTSKADTSNCVQVSDPAAAPSLGGGAPEPRQCCPRREEMPRLSYAFL